MATRLFTRPALHTAAVYVMVFAATGAYMPFWPLWLDDWGLTTEEVGLYTALGIAVRVVAGLAIPALADRLDARRYTLAACALATALIFLAHLGIHPKPVLLLATLAARRHLGRHRADLRGAGRRGGARPRLRLCRRPAASARWASSAPTSRSAR